MEIIIYNILLFLAGFFWGMAFVEGKKYFKARKEYKKILSKIKNYNKD